MSAGHAAAPTLPAGWLARVRQRAFRHLPADGEAVRLAHSRIYILPTRRGLAFLVTLGMMLLTSLNYGMSLGFVVTFLLTGLVGAALLHAFRNVAGVEIRAIAGGESFVGGRLAYDLALDGGGVPRTSITVDNRGRTCAWLDLPPDRAMKLSIEADATTRGRAPLGRITVWSDFPLGVWRCWSYVHFPLAALAYPAPESGAPPVPVATANGEGEAGGHGDDADLAGLRAYQAGDPLQRVAWKAVARGAGWYSKAFDGAAGPGSVVLDWAHLPSALPLEAKLSRLTAWVLACERAARPYGLRIPGASIAPGQGREHRRAVLTALALFDSERS